MQFFSTRNIQKLAGLTGEGTIARKVTLVAELLSSAKPLEAKFIARTVLEEMRVGVAEGIVRDAIAQVYNVDSKEVERAYNLILDFAEVARMAKSKTLGKASLSPSQPSKCMLANPKSLISLLFLPNSIPLSVDISIV